MIKILTYLSVAVALSACSTGINIYNEQQLWAGCVDQISP